MARYTAHEKVLCKCVHFMAYLWYNCGKCGVKFLNQLELWNDWPLHTHARFRPSHLKIPGGPKMARATLSRRAMCGNVAAKWGDASPAPVWCLAARRATFGPYRPPLDRLKMARLKKRPGKIVEYLFVLYQASTNAPFCRFWPGRFPPADPQNGWQYLCFKAP